MYVILVLEVSWIRPKCEWPFSHLSMPRGAKEMNGFPWKCNLSDRWTKTEEALVAPIGDVECRMYAELADTADERHEFASHALGEGDVDDER
jgi:hypothetical protein